MSRLVTAASEALLLASGAQLHGAALLLDDADARGEGVRAAAAALSVAAIVERIAMEQAHTPTGALIQARALDTLVDHIEDPELNAQARRLLQSLTLYLEETAGASRDDWGGGLSVR